MSTERSQSPPNRAPRTGAHGRHAMTAILLCLAASAGVPTAQAELVAEDLHAGDAPAMRYILLRPADDAEMPADGYGLVIVLPGGDGGERYGPFVRRLAEEAVGPGCLVAELVAPELRPGDVVWPVAGQAEAAETDRPATEEFVEAVIADVAGRYEVDGSGVFLLAWGEAGPAAYASALREGTSVRGAFVAMSPFEPKGLQPLSRAAGKAFYLYHSREDKVYPFSIAKGAQWSLAGNGARVQLADYPGGHGWHGDIAADVRTGMAWLRNASDQLAGDAPAAEPAVVLIEDGFESGTDLPDGWSQAAQVVGVEYEWDRGAGHTGTSSLALRKSVDRYSPAAEWRRALPLDLAAGQLRVDCMVKAEKAEKAAIDVRFLDADGREIRHAWLVRIGAHKAGDQAADHEWMPYSGKADVPPNAVKARIAFQIYGPGAVWLDDLRISRVGPQAPRELKRDEEATRRKVLREILGTPEEEKPEKQPAKPQSILRHVPIIIQ